MQLQALLSLLSLSLVFALELRHSQQHSHEAVAQIVSQKNVAAPTTQHHLMDVAAMDDQKFLDLLNLNSSMMVGRLQVYSTDHSEPRCLRLEGQDYKRGKKNKNGVVSAPCQYNLRFFYFYDPEEQVLRSVKFPDLRLAVNGGSSGQHESWFNLGFFTKEHIETKQEEAEQWAGQVSFDASTFSVISFANPSFPDSSPLCLRAASYGRSETVRAVQQGDSTACSLMRFVSIFDDFSIGRFVYQVTPTSFQCVTYNPSAELPRSTLYLQDCRQDMQNQQFMYNEINGHIRARTQETILQRNPLIFMWWSGPLRPYLQVPLTSEKTNYGWSVAQPGLYGPILSRDTRGYSGNCWMIDKSQDIVGNQTCNRFKFDTIKLSPELALKESMKSYHNAAVMLRVEVQGQLKCLYVHRVFRRGVAGEKLSVFKLGLVKCSAFLSEQRFVLISKDKTCLAKDSCNAHLRWAGDPSNGLIWKRPSGVSSQAKGQRQRYIEEQALSPQARLESLADEEWVLPIRQYNPIYGTKSAKTKCWGFESSTLFFGESKRCLKWQVIPLQDIYSGPKDLLLIEEFRRSATVNMALDQQNKNRDTFNRFFVDSGFFGLRRFMRPWHSDFEENGALFLPQGLLLPFPFQPNPYLTRSSNGLISIRFGAPEAVQVRAFTGRAFMLFTFMGKQGCLVYITKQGHLGLRCSTTQGPRHCQFRFEDGFSLLDGSIHTVSLLYSWKGDTAHVLYVDQREVGRCQFPGWDLSEANQWLRIFYDSADWQFFAFAGRVTRVSVLTGSFNSLHQVGTRQVSFMPSETRLANLNSTYRRGTSFMDSMGFGDEDADDLYYDSNSKSTPTQIDTENSEPEVEDSATGPENSDIVLVEHGNSLAHGARRLQAVLAQQSEQSDRALANKPIATDAEIKAERAMFRGWYSRLQQANIPVSDDDWNSYRAEEFSATKLSPFRTSWQNCTAISDPKTELHTGLRCQLVIHSPDVIPLDVFQFGCSRPRCQLHFVGKQPVNQNRYFFEYRPMYPDSFVSEDVGNPGLFPDLTILTDGFANGKVAFDIDYEPESSDSLIEAKVSENVKYVMFESGFSKIWPPLTISEENVF